MNQVGPGGKDRDIFPRDQLERIPGAVPDVVGDPRLVSDLNIPVEIILEDAIDGDILDDRITEGLFEPGTLEAASVDVVDVAAPHMVEGRNLRECMEYLTLYPLSTGIEEVRLKAYLNPGGHEDLPFFLDVKIWRAFHALPLGFALHAERGKRHGLKSPSRYIFTAVFTEAVFTVLHS